MDTLTTNAAFIRLARYNTSDDLDIFFASTLDTVPNTYFIK